MYLLYFNPGAASFAVHWFLNEIKAPHRLELVDFDSKQQKSSEYLKLNPGGMVPTLVIDGIPHTECAALLLLLAERHADAGLQPAIGATGRQEYLQWMLYFANTVQPAYRAWFYPHEPAGEPYIDAVKAHARVRIENIWTRIDALLAQRSFITGEKMTAVDFLAAMLMRWSRNMPKPATEWPALNAYIHRMRALPSYADTLKAEKLTDWINKPTEHAERLNI